MQHKKKLGWGMGGGKKKQHSPAAMVMVLNKELLVTVGVCKLHYLKHWTSPDGKTHNQIDHVLIDRRWQSSVLHVRSFWGAECDTDHYLVIAKVRERLAVGKQATQRLDRHRFNLSKLNELEVRKQYQIEFTNRFAALETLNEDEDVNRIWGNIKHNIQISAKGSLGMHEWK